MIRASAASILSSALQRPAIRACLTDPQIKTLKTIYSGAHDAAGKQIFPGLLPGAEDGEDGWANWVTGKEEGKSAGVFYVGGYFANMVYEKKDWDPQSANVGGAMKLAYEKTGDQLRCHES